MDKNKELKERILEVSGSNARKCMRCGKCTATCPSFDNMEYHPHPPSDTFLHVRKYREIMFPGERNAVSGGVRSPSECRFECFAGRNSQSRAAE